MLQAAHGDERSNKKWLRGGWGSQLYIEMLTLYIAVVKEIVLVILSIPLVSISIYDHIISYP